MNPEGLWFREIFTDNLIFGYRVKKVLYSGHSKFQKIDILDLYAYGKTLFLDNKIQSAQLDEHIYHEALVQPAMFTHPAPKSALIIGGGEGATLRETLKHNTIKRATMVDIDGELVEASRKYLPEWSDGAYEDSRTELIIDDARKYIFETDQKFDVAISDLTEPLEEGPSKYLFTLEFYKRIHDILTENGVLVVQSGSAVQTYNDLAASIYKTLKELFKFVRVYVVYIESFQMLWAFTVASKGQDPGNIREEILEDRLKSRGVGNLKFYLPRYHRGLFYLPRYLDEKLPEGRILTDENPYIWTA